jgi:transposase InsO family protein
MDFCSKHGIKRKILFSRTPQQNGVVERKNRKVQEMDQTMLMDYKLTYVFWAHVVHTLVYIQNKVILRNNSDKNSL